MADHRERDTEAEIRAKGLTAPRVTPEHIDAVIAEKHYVVFPGSTVTVCGLVLANGFVVAGYSGAASPENFDRELGRRLAYEDARRQVWVLEEYLLRQRLHEQAQQEQIAERLDT